MDVYTIRNENDSHVAISDGFIGGSKPETLKIGEVWVVAGPSAFSKMLKASGKAAAMRFKCAQSDVKTTCIGEPA